MPASWLAGTSPSGFEPWNRHGWIAAVVAALVLTTGAMALWWPVAHPRLGRGGPLRWGEAAGAANQSLAGDRLPFALEIGALVAAAVLAAPVGWYHYQLCQFPAFAVVVERAFAARRRRAALLWLLLLAVLTRAQAWGFGRYVDRWGWTAQAPVALWAVTAVVPVAAAVWAAYLVREARRGRRLSPA